MVPFLRVPLAALALAGAPAAAGLVESSSPGSAVRRAGDVDGDGVPDLLAADRPEEVVWVLSGVDGEPLLCLARDGVPGFGAAVESAGDVDGDGRADVLVGAARHGGRGGGGAFVFSGKDGALLHELRSPRDDPTFGWAVGGGHDADGDGVPDLAVGEPGHRGRDRGRAYVHSGATGALLRTFEAKESRAATWTPAEEAPPPWQDERIRDEFGGAVALVPDLDGNGRTEVVIGCLLVGGPPPPPQDRYEDVADALFGHLPRDEPEVALELHPPYGYVDVRDGATGAPLFLFVATRSDGHAFAETVGDAGDVDGDGVRDLYTSSEHSAARVLSGRTGERLHEVSFGIGMDGQGHTMDRVGDVDGDGHADFAVGWSDAPFGGDSADAPGVAQLYSGKDASLLWEWRTPKEGQGDGVDVCGAGDVDGDGRPDLALHWFQRRRVSLISGAGFRRVFEVDLASLQERARPAERRSK